MPEYLSPGVYIEEVEAGPKPIEGVSTSTTGMVGVTMRGPSSGKPELVTSFADYLRKFGGFIPPQSPAVVAAWETADTGGYWWNFPLSVKGYFDNGGQRLYVKRVVSSQGAKKSTLNAGMGVLASLDKDTAAGAATVTLGSLIGVSKGTTLKFIRGDSAAEVGAPTVFTVASYDVSSRQATLDNPIPEALSMRRGDYVVIAAYAAGPTLTFDAISEGVWGDGLSVFVEPTYAQTSFPLMASPVAAIAGPVLVTKITEVPVPPAPGAPWVIKVDDVAGLANGHRVLIEDEQYKVANLDGPNKKFEVSAAIAGGTAPIPWAVGTVVRRVQRAYDAGTPGVKINVWNASQLYVDALVELDNGEDKEVWRVKTITGDTVELKDGAGAAIAKSYYRGQALRVIEAHVLVSLTDSGQVTGTEEFSGLRLTNSNPTMFIVNYINERSKWVRVRDMGLVNNDLSKFPTTRRAAFEPLANGADGWDKLTIDDFVGTDNGPGKRTGIAAMEDIDEVSIVTVPGMWAPPATGALIQHCESLKDRFAILDPQPRLGIAEIMSFKENLDSKYAALYYPWLIVRDPSLKNDVPVAPSGHMAGLYARVDTERGVHKAPGNEVMRGITRFEQDINKREQDMLNPRNINVFRAFPGRGLRIWGARTISSDSQWKYINVRRLFIYVEESIDKGTQWVVFEPNDDPLWARVRQSISNFLLSTWRSGALEGTKAEEAFFVKCDRSTMTQDDIDNGRLICHIGIAPVKPAEFVIFRFEQKTREAAQS